MDGYVWIGIIIGLITVIYLKLRRYGGREYVYPPGPSGLPFLGSALSVNRRKIFASFAEMSQKYGEIFTVTIMGKTIVVLNTSKVIKEFFEGDKTRTVLAGRPKIFLTEFVIDNSIIGTRELNKKLGTMRRLIFSAIDYDSKHRNHNLLTDELRCLVHSVNEQEERPFDPSDVIRLCFANIYAIAMRGERYDYDDPKIRIGLGYVDSLLKFIDPTVSGLLNIFPWLRKLTNLKIGKIYEEAIAAKENYLTHYLEEQPTSPGKSPRYRGMVGLLRAGVSATYGELTEEQLKGIVLDLTHGGFPGAISAIFLCLHVTTSIPSVARKIQEEINLVIGQGRLPELDDITEMPYTMSTIYETLRTGTPVRLASTREATADVKLGCYHIPKGTLVMANLWAAHHDEKAWQAPNEFDPARFLDSHGKMLPKDHAMMQSLLPFGAGERRCPGSPFAVSRIFLVLTTLLQNFNLVPEDSTTFPAYDPLKYDMADLTFCLPCKIKAVPRNSSKLSNNVH